MPPIQIGADHARRFLVTRHLLAPARSLPATPQSVLDVVERLGLLQFDPLEVPGARNHDLVLHARIGGYRREWADAWLYGPDRRLIELYNKSLNIVPMEELPHYRIAWTRSGDYYNERILAEQGDVAKAILKRLKTDAPLSTAAFSEHAHSIDWWWAPTRASRAVMEALFVTGRIGIARRDGNRRYYDLIERLVPADLLKHSEPEEEAMTHRLLSRYRATGMTMPSNGTQSEVMYSAGATAERVRRTAKLVDDGVLLPVDVEGLKAPRYILASEASILQDAADPASISASVSFLAPLDPLTWDRKGLLRGLFGFDYLWEVYVPEAKRRWGYYVLPILYGDRFVGRIEPRLDRKTRTLTVLGVWFEPGFEPMEDAGFAAALADAVAAYRDFVGADRVTWPRTRTGRLVAAMLRTAA
ncbi:MAG TPA: crosslink repair DNA glycosylase YcaQ family protein [Candidatus Limnocylindria bacterium]|nr:crosslink repair DNA glycosylase YcaQ family protein [Candidatus Limnocylindria bacterium]